MQDIHIEDYIPTGREHAVTRKQLCSVTGLPDRAMREAIEQARRRGVIIVNAQDGAGYYITDDPKDIKRQYEQNKHRALSILVQQKHLRKSLKTAGML